MIRTFRQIAGAGVALSMLASCGGTGFDPDLRSWAPGGFSTADAASRAQPRPQPDSRGLITFPNYQAVVAAKGDTPTTIATRLGLNGTELARHNALPADSQLYAGQVLVLPRRVAAGTGAAAPTAGRVSTTGMVSDPFAGQPAVTPGRRATATATPAATPAPAAAGTSDARPEQHVVVAGETAWSISRKYGVSVQDLASWNGLPASMGLRTGQRLMVPVAGQSAPSATAITTAPGSGSPTPRPPSASEPLPRETTRPAAEPGPKAPQTDLGATRTAASDTSKLQMPVGGAIIRVYEKGKNEGIDIAAPAGTAVKAAASGTVAAITRDTGGVPIIVVRHTGNLMTVYTGLGSDVTVAKGDAVTNGQQLGKAGSGGFVHFEVRRGFESVDPESFF